MVLLISLFWCFFHIAQTPPSLLHKWGDEIFQKMAVMGDGKSLLEMGGMPRMRGLVGFIMVGGGGGRGGKFLKSLWIVSRGALTLLFFEDPLYCLPGHPFIAYSVTSNPQPPLLFLLSCFFGWMGNHTTFDALFYLKIIWIYTCQSLVP